MADDLSRLPCGCVMGTRGEAFLIQPCAEDCEYYLYALDVAAEQHKPTVHQAAPGVLPAEIRDALAPDVNLSRLAGFPVYPLFETMHTADGSVTLEYPAWEAVKAAMEPPANEVSG